MPVKLAENQVLSLLKDKYPTYSFDKFKYSGQLVESIVICPEHGEVQRSYKDMIRTESACPICRSNNPYTTTSFIEKLKTVFPETWNRYDYSKLEYRGAFNKIIITCPEHGDYLVKPSSLIVNPSRAPCAKCNIKNKHLDQINTLNSFLVKLPNTTKDKLSFSNSTYLSSKSKMEVECKIHGKYLTKPNYIMEGKGCPSCSRTRKSRLEQEVFDFIKNLDGSTLSRVRLKELEGKELDIYVPSKNLAVEFNGLFFHRKRDVLDTYANLAASSFSILEKTNLCEKNGIRLIHIFEDEWLEKQDIVKNRLRAILGVSEKVGARKCHIKEISLLELKAFEQTFHIQGHALAKYRYGLYYQDDLVATMSFTSLRFNNEEEGAFELLRFCSSESIQGGFSKLLSRFIKDKNPKKIVSYSDRRWSLGEVYSKQGFIKVSTSKPGYFWCKGQKRWNRMNFQKHKLKEILEEAFDESKTEKELMFQARYFLVEDCGQDRWELDLTK